MKIKIIYISLLILSVGALFSCQEKEIDRYENDPRLYFFRSSYVQGQRDSISASFFILGNLASRDTVYLEIRTMGMPSTERRFFKVEQMNVGEAHAAISGKHFVAFDDEVYKSLWVVEPGEITATLPIILLRDASLKSEEVRLEITFAENEYFKSGIINNSRFVIKISDYATKPATWDGWYVLGAWGPQKMLFLIQYVGIDFNDDPTKYTADYNYLMYLMGLANEALANYTASHDKPLQEEDGTLVSF
jgi:hypothetical protein